MSGQHCEWY
ncbi:Protein of unknown function [Gryllus bimaculatus]|nr:Protein of unknown function [Gryllus bimaculatus]